MVNGRKVVFVKSAEEYFDIPEGTWGIWGILYLGGKDYICRETTLKKSRQAEA